MILIKTNPGNIVLYAGTDIVLTDKGTSSALGNWQDLNVTTANAVVDNGNPPISWIGGGWSFVGGAWTQVSSPPMPVPQSVSSFQAKAALLATPSGSGTLLDSVNALMANPATSKLMVLEWNDATEFLRSSSTVSAITASLGLTSAQVDALFILAAGITA